MGKQKKQKSNRRNAGFTMAELLIVVAIIGVLGAVAIVGVVNYMRSMTKLEYDGYAKEIFIAAQNHLTLADSQGLVAKAAKGVADDPKQVMGLFAAQEDDAPKTTAESENGIYYFVVYDSNSREALNGYSSALGLMLPFASIDETIRLGGCYLIQYNENTGRVLKVFYWDEKGRYPYKYTDSDDYAKLIEVSGSTDNKSQFKSYSFESNSNSVIGYYNGDDLEKGDPLKKPTIKVINGSKLMVEVTDPNDGDVVRKLIVKGLTSKKEKALTYKTSTEWPEKDGQKLLNQSFKGTVILDDITTEGKGFSDIFTVTEGFIPGEDITVQLVVMSTNNLATPAYSAILQTNSLFESIAGEKLESSINYAKSTAKISNIRHLENLSNTVSGVNANAVSVQIIKAEQTSDFSWKTFSEETAEDGKNASIDGLTKESFYPVNIGVPLDYDGKYHSISDVVITETGTDETGINQFGGNAGLFRTLTISTPVHDLKLVNFQVEGKNNAGALAGTVAGSDITNVLAVNSLVKEVNSNTENTEGSEASDGQDPEDGDVSSDTEQGESLVSGVNAGGLIGLLSSGSVQKCGASVIVNAPSGTAGGLIGKAESGTIAACYSGGHTVNGSYKDSEGNTAFDVTGATAGGLVGEANGATIQCSYSTCSVQGTTAAGGFVGTASGTISSCYATGLVKGTAATVRGAFAGQTALNGATNCQYFEIINEEKSDAGYTYLTPLAKRIEDEKPVENSGTSNAITALDADASSYNTFSGDPSKEWKAAVPYDDKLKDYYQELYNLKTVAELGATVEKTDFVVAHYGDWPAPEVFVINN